MLLFWAIPTSAENHRSIRSVKMSLVYMTSFKNIFKNLEVANYDLAPGHYYYLKCIFILAASASPKRFFRNVHPPPLTVPRLTESETVFLSSPGDSWHMLKFESIYLDYLQAGINTVSPTTHPYKLVILSTLLTQILVSKYHSPVSGFKAFTYYSCNFSLNLTF